MLDEETYKEIIRDITGNSTPGAILHNLPYRDWAPLIKFSRYVDHKGNIFKYFVPNQYNGWNTYLQFMDWDEQLVDPSITPTEMARLLLWAGDIRVHCSCPAYKFWGHQYVATQHEAAIIPENRFPAIRNPQLKGQLCKHLRVSIKTVPFHLGEIAQAIKATRLEMSETTIG